MRRPVFAFAVAALIALGAVGACTQDFDQFDPESSGSGASSSTSTTSSSTSSGMGGQGGASSSSTSSTSTGGEDCLNGEDDNGDGSIDCADAACADFECVGVPATGSWMGPGLLYDGDPGMVPDCPPEFPDVAYEGFADVIQQNATCSQCACAPSITCTPNDLFAYGNGSCGGGSNNETQPTAGNMCAAFDGSGAGSYRAQAPSVNAGQCQSSGGIPTIPPPQSQRAARICSVTLSGAGCGAADEICVPSDVTAPFQGHVCIWRDADVNCPSGYPDQHQFSTTVNDTRGCTGCGCGNPANATCTVTTTVYSDANCTTQIASVPNTNSCVAAGQGQSIMIAKTTMGGGCGANGGQPTGSISLGQDRMTVCCR